MIRRHAAYARAHGELRAAQHALRAAFDAHGIRPGPPPSPADGDALEPAELTQARETLRAAHQAFDTAAARVADEVDKVWESHRLAVEIARAALEDALQTQAHVEVVVGEAARRRDASHPVLNVDEKARVAAARATTAEARRAHQQTLATFKAGVTPDQLHQLRG